MKRFRWLFLVVLLTLATGCPAGGPSPPPSSPPPQPDTAQIEAPGLDNVFRITDRLYSGSAPEGDAGFQSLDQLGVKTVISVDGARPDVERAHSFGMRYVHLPFGYDGVPEDQALRLAKAVRDLPGPVYLHCHHGKHRGPAAAAVVHLCLDRQCPVETALAEMRRAGTDPRYTGLYDAPRTLHRPTPEELDCLPADFPEVAEVPALAQVMVEVDGRWGNLKQARSAGWKSPAGHPDVDPPHEALQLVEQFREATRLAEVKKRPEEFRHRLADAGAAAAALEDVLRQEAVDVSAADEAFSKAEAACAACHARYRDVPQSR
jgi:protein tyrosine phosphatase (PTP) superfamily phosphohydrolase (DUF442 family)